MSRRPYSEAIQYPSCRGKNRYPTIERAESARMRRQIAHGLLFRIYKCDSCEYFHFARVKRDGKPVPYIHIKGSPDG